MKLQGKYKVKYEIFNAGDETRVNPIGCLEVAAGVATLPDPDPFAEKEEEPEWMEQEVVEDEPEYEEVDEEEAEDDGGSWWDWGKK